MKQVTKETVYRSAQESFGIVPPMIKEIAEFSVPAAALYVDGVRTMNAAALSEMEINAIELRISSLNRCASCVKGHSYLSKKAGLSDEDIQALVEGRPTSIESLNRKIRGTEAIFYANRGGYAMYIDELEAERFTRQEVYEIIGLLSLKTISNNINNYVQAVRAAQVQYSSNF
ncbi:carboxymuconolactone decarboxylase family protein [Flavihumibacter fluvii]|uniref:carboxymuconolactone decarboxylase family protein n=1 Tax=Flavihumibacter fluvii TaxID=2838157 RepID=UPI001BDE7C86|nr:carboxymuconolactone decarboxylase family protein [Flavihumibacter fluvii]ULQ51728.1 carboxymuconolactone decarboxylase family protein [Flavihumibacter fluvii]